MLRRPFVPFVPPSGCFASNIIFRLDSYLVGAKQVVKDAIVMYGQAPAGAATGAGKKGRKVSLASVAKAVRYTVRRGLPVHLIGPLKGQL